MTVLSYTNAFPGIPAPQHLTGQTTVQNYLYPGALQPKQTGPTVLSWINAFLGIPVPQNLSGQTSVQSFIYPGALQPLQPPTTAFLVFQKQTISAQTVTTATWTLKLT